MISLLRRTAVIGSTFVVVLSLAAPAALADELADILDQANDATYTATRLTVSVWGNRTSVTRERVEHAHGSEMIRIDETWSMVGNGRTVTMGDTDDALAFMTSGVTVATGRYEIGTISKVRHMHRTCQLVPIMEDGALRATMIIDDRTGAPLIASFFDASGRTYRTVSLADFAPHRTYEWPGDSTDVPFEVVMHDDDETVPSEVSGYVLVDEFPAPAGSEQGYYTDGLFSFSLFVMPASTLVDGFDDPVTMVTPNGIYDMVPSAQAIRVHWSDADAHYVLVGDLPPDHLEAVLLDLPKPGPDGMFSRLWHRLFG